MKPTMVRPATTTRLVPKRNTSRGAMGEPIISPMATGVNIMPALSGL